MVLDMTNGLTRTLVAGAGFFGDQYANNVIGREFWGRDPLSLPPSLPPSL